MSELSTLVGKWETAIAAWVKGIEPIVLAEFDVLMSLFKTAIGPPALAAAESTIALIGQEITGTLTGPALVTDIENIGKNLITLVENTIKTLAAQGITATGTQILGALSTQLAVNGAVADTSTTTAAPPPTSPAATINATLGG